MNNDRIAAIRERYKYADDSYDRDDIFLSWLDIDDLLTEIDRLTTELAKEKEEANADYSEIADTMAAMVMEIAKLRSQLAASQRREQAAVKDLNAFLQMDELCPIQCEFCKWKNDCDGTQKPEWRGPQEGGE